MYQYNIITDFVYRCLTLNHLHTGLLRLKRVLNVLFVTDLTGSPVVVYCPVETLDET